MYEIKVTVDVPGLPEAISALANALNRLQPANAISSEPVEAAQTAEGNPTILSTPAAGNTAPAAATTPAQSSPAAPVTEQTRTIGSTLPTSEAKSYTLDDLSRAGAVLIDQGKMPQLLDLLKKYGVQAVTQLNKSVYPAFVEEMKALGAQL